MAASARSSLALGVLVSGNGSNLQAILDAIAEERLNARVELVISNRAGVTALDRASAAGVTARVIAHREFQTREAFDAALVAAFEQARAEWIVLAGFMRVLTPTFLRAFPGRIINIHPALLPAFPGVDAIGQALAYGVKVTGCSVHFVDEGVDTGSIIAQTPLSVELGDDHDSLAKRMHVAEHRLLVHALSEIARGRISPNAQRVVPPEPA